MINNGFDSFSTYLEKVNTLLDKAADKKNPALWLFENNARTPFFMLEGLAKIYSGVKDSKVMDDLKDHFKLIEDCLGKIDHYNSLRIAFADNKEIPAECKEYVAGRLEESAKETNEVLEKKDWISKDSERVQKLTKKLEGYNWSDPVTEVGDIFSFYNNSIASIEKFVAKTEYHFDNVEKDVHELRRKLRWLSIYPQALQGLIQYDTEELTSPHLKKYLTDEIVNSPFNKLPSPGKNTCFLLLNKNYFLALSWTIAELGRLKDQGLLLTGLAEAMQEKIEEFDEKTLAKAALLLGSPQIRMQAILDEAEKITKTFFEEGNLQYLVAGIKRVD